MHIKHQSGWVEFWKAVPDYEGYEASTLGRIRSWRHSSGSRLRNPRVLKPNLNSRGYPSIRLYIGNKVSVYRTTHRVIMRTFCPSGESDVPQINHIDGVKSNSRLDNLEWCSHGENIRHAFSISLIPVGVNHCNAHHSQAECEAARAEILKGRRLSSVGKELGFSYPILRAIKDGTHWSCRSE